MFNDKIELEKIMGGIIKWIKNKCQLSEFQWT